MRRSALILAFWALAASPVAAADNAQTATGSDGSTITIEAQAVTSTPYRNQSILYTLRCAVRGGISEITLSNIDVSDAIVQRQGKPDVHDEMNHGVPVRVASFRFIVTPLKAGRLTIPAVTLSGKFEAPDLSAASNPLGMKLSSGVRQAFSFFSANGAEPFSVTSNAVQLTVKPPAAAMDPWLPLNSLKIIDDSDAPRTVHVGEPLARKITLLADGAVGSQIPDLAPQADDANFKAYVDSNATGEDVDIKSGSILGWRKQEFSLIPQKAGRLVLPAIRVSWWDLAKKKRATAELSERIIDVLPAAIARAAHPMRTVIPPAAPKPFDFRHLLLKARWTLVLLGSVVAVALMFVILRLFKAWQAGHIESGSETPRRASKTRPSKTASSKTLNEVHTPEQLKLFLQAYAHMYGDVPRNASLETIAAALVPPPSAEENDDAEIVFRSLSAALYGGIDINIEDIKPRARRMLSRLEHKAKGRLSRGETLPGLNPL